MATRLYPAKRAPGTIMHGALEGAWTGLGYFDVVSSPVQNRFELQASNAGAGSKTSFQLACNHQLDTHYTSFQTAPLAAQVLTPGETLTICFRVQCRFAENSVGYSNDATGTYKVHVYLADGQTTTVKTVLAANQISGSAFPGTSGAEWRTFGITLAGATVAAGDIIIIEVGTHLITFPSPIQHNYFPADTDFAEFTWGYLGAVSGGTDATNGATSTTLNPWLEFSQTLSFAALPAPPVNDDCADAIDFTAPLTAGRYDSGFIDVSQSADTQRRVWWTVTAPITGKLALVTFGANYLAAIDVFRGTCGSLSTAGFQVTTDNAGTHRSLCTVMIDVTQGTTYVVRVQSQASAFHSDAQSGVCRLQAFYRSTTPVEDDVYLPANVLAQVRDGELVTFNSGLGSANGVLTGVAIDYTKRPMDDLNTGGTNTNERILVGLHDFELVEILNLPDLSYGQWPFQNEVDFLGDPWSVPTINIHPAQSHVTPVGLLHQGWFGNGYLWIAGNFTGGAPPAVLNDVSNDADHSALKTIDAINGDTQSGAPFTDSLQYPTIENTAPWAFDVSDSGVMAYVSGPFYGPIEDDATYAGPQTIRQFNVGTNTQLANFASLSLVSGPAPGLRGLRWLSDGGMLVCNGPVVQRLNSSGAVIGTYTPSIALDSQVLVDLVLLAGGDTAVVVDLLTTRLFKFRISTMAELDTWQFYLATEQTTQIQAYLPSGVGAVPIAAGCVIDPVSLNCITHVRPSSQCLASDIASTGCIETTPSRSSAGCIGTDTRPSSGCISTTPTRTKFGLLES